MGQEPIAVIKINIYENNIVINNKFDTAPCQWLVMCVPSGGARPLWHHG